MKLIKSPVTWIGNKSSILHTLYVRFPEAYERYIEPFGGSCSVLLGKAEPDKFEVYNDYNANLVNLFRCMRDRPLKFIQELGFLSLNARDDFIAIKQFFQKEAFYDAFTAEEAELTAVLLPEPSAGEIRELYRAATADYDLRRAAMFLKLVRTSYSSGCKSFACQPFHVASLFNLIWALSERMADVVIENQDFEVLIRHYDRPDAFIYCDPPYFSSEYFYACGFTWEDHLRLFQALKDAHGLWMVSYNDCPNIRALYKDYCIFEFKRPHSMVQKYEAGKEFSEIIITNYDPLERLRNEPRQLTLFGEKEYNT